MRPQSAALIVLALLPGPALDAQGPRASCTTRNGEYLAVIDLYRGGATRDAVDAVVKPGPRALLMHDDLQQWDRLAGDPVSVYAPAGAMLHTDVVDALWHERRDAALQHLDMAKAWADLEVRLNGRRGNVQARRGYLR